MEIMLRQLVLTGAEEFWPDYPEDALFLGAWCFAHNKKAKFLDGKMHAIAAPVWSEKDIIQPYEYIWQLKHRILVAFTKSIQDSSPKVSSKYWEVLLSTWIVQWLGHVYDRYTRIKAVDDSLGQPLTVGVVSGLLSRCDSDWSYYGSFDCHYSNLAIMSDIILNCDFKNLKPMQPSQKALGSIAKKLESRLVRPRSKTLARLIQKLRLKSLINDYMGCTHDVLIGSPTGASLQDRFLLKVLSAPLSLLSLPLFRKKILRLGAEVEPGQLLPIQAENEFETLVAKLFYRYLPSEFLSIKYDFRGSQKYWIGCDLFLGTHHAAAFAEAGGHLMPFQHGGGYGMFECFPIQDLEHTLSSVYFTWGWSDQPPFSTVLPSPLLQKAHKLMRDGFCDGSILFMTTAHPTYSYRLHSMLQPHSAPGFLEAKLSFLKSLGEEVRIRLKIRPYPNDYGTGEAEYMASLGFEDKLITRSSGLELIARAQICIFDHPMTGFLQSIVMNKPTIIFFNPNHFYLNDQAKQIFQKLAEAHIYFSDPDSAAAWLHDVSGEVDAWWNSVAVTSAVSEFRKLYARTDKNWLQTWSRYIRKLSKTQNSLPATSYSTHI
jgi:putative transferase (TIGR04331 family)